MNSSPLTFLYAYGDSDLTASSLNLNSRVLKSQSMPNAHCVSQAPKVLHTYIHG